MFYAKKKWCKLGLLVICPKRNERNGIMLDLIQLFFSRSDKIMVNVESRFMNGKEIDF